MRPPDPVAGHLRLADAVLGQELAHHRREHRGPDAVTVGARGRAPGRRGRRRSGRVRRWRWWRRWRRGGAAGRRWWLVRAAAAGGGRRLGCGGRPDGGRAGTVADHGQPHADLDGLALGDEDLGQDAGGRRRHLGVDLVRRHLEERLVALDRVADGLHPAGDRSLGHRLAELRHHHVSQRADPFRSAPASSRRRSRTATGAAG